MKIALFALVALISGCATQPLTFDQRMQLMRAMQQNRPIVADPPAMAPVNRQITCYTNGNMTTCQ